MCAMSLSTSPKGLPPVERRKIIRRLAGLATMYAGGKRSFQVIVRGTRSYWNPSGVVCIQEQAEKRPLTEREMEALLIHECGHVRHTEEKAGGRLPVPFDLFNILEDQRIEFLQKEDFFDAEELLDELNTNFERDAYPKTSEKEEDYVRSVASQLVSPSNEVNGHNLLLLLCYGGWQGLDTPVRKHLDKIIHEMNQTVPDVKSFCVDALAAIVESVAAKSSAELVSKVAKPFYEKWKDFFQTKSMRNFEIPMGPDGAFMDAQGPLGLSDTGGVRDEEVNSYNENSESDMQEDFVWDEERIRQEAGILRRLLNEGDSYTKENSARGKAIDPRRFRVQTTKVFTEKTLQEGGTTQAPLVVISDMSGSMSGGPYENGCHIVRILEESKCFPDMQVIQCASNIFGPVSNFYSLNLHSATGGDEAFDQLLPVKFPEGAVLIFLTDANTGGASAEAIKTLARKYKTLGLYVANAMQDENPHSTRIKAFGEELFPVFLTAPKLDRVGVVLGRFLQRRVNNRRGIFTYKT